MLKFKKIFSAFVGMIMAANIFTTASVTALAEEETSSTYAYDGYEVSYNITNSWGNTEVVSVTLSNTGDSDIENWMLYFEPNGQVHNLVNVVEEQTSTGISYFKNSRYNANVNPDSSVSFSYMVDDCEAMPDSFILCQTRAKKESGYQVSLNVNQTWGDSFNGEIIISNNTDKPIESWELMVDTNFTITEITNSWAATVTELDPYSYMLKGTYTGTVYANSSVSLGFNGVKSGEPIISDYSLTEVTVDEEKISTSQSDNKIFEDNYVSNNVYAEASYNPKNENIDVSWTATTIGSSFEVYVSDDNKNYELYETLDGNTFNAAYHTSGDFRIKYFKIKQTLPGHDDLIEIYSNICYAVYAPEGTDWKEYLRQWNLPDDNDELLSEINTDGAPYKLSVEFQGAGIPDIHMIASESSYTNAIKNDYILGATPELTYKEGLSIKDIKIKFEISEKYLDNELGTLKDNSEFSKIKRFNIFKYFEDVNMLLPIETKFDENNNKILYAEVDELGTYCVVDMEKWLQSLNVDEDTINKLSKSNSTAAVNSIISDEPIPENIEGDLAVMSAGEPADNEIQTFSNVNIVLNEPSEELVDIVFVLQSAGLVNNNKNDFNSQKQMILDTSEAIFTTYPNARIYVIGFTDGQAEFWNNGDPKINYFSSRAEMECFNDYEYQNYNDFVNRSPAYEKFDKIDFRDNAKKFAFTIFNGNSDCKGDINEFDICNKWDLNYSEVYLPGSSIVGNIDAMEALDNIITHNGICIINDENSAKIIYEHICDNLKLKVTEGYEDKIYFGVDWNEISLKSPLKVNGSIDSDDDGLTDWEEVNSDLLIKNENIHDGTNYIKDSTIKEENMPSVWYMLKSQPNFIPFRYVNVNNSDVLSILNKIKVLPVNSNPTEESSAGDGINDFDKMKVENTAEDSNQDGSNTSDTTPKNIFDKYKSSFYKTSDPNYSHYDDSSYYLNRLDDRYKIKKPFKSYTIEALFPEFKDKTKNNETNSVYYKVEREENTNIITICPTIFFTRDYNKNASDCLSNYEGNKELYQFFIEGLQNQWGQNFTGTIFDFYPGMEIKTIVEVDSYYQNDSKRTIPNGQNYITVDIKNDIGGSATGYNEMGVYTGEPNIPKYNTLQFENVCAHEFGHILNLADAYAGMNNNLTSIFIENENENRELTKNDIMNNNEKVKLNDIEMAIYGFIVKENKKAQYFTPTYYDKYENEISPAIREKPVYQYFRNNDMPEYDTIYQIGTDYKWVDGKGYIPTKADIIADEGTGLKYYIEDNHIVIYGLSDDNYSGIVKIPAKIGDYDVTKIADGAFRGSNISFITFEKQENITGIGMGAFYNCSELKEISIPQNIKIILPHTFENCTNLNYDNPEEFKIPEGVVTIGMFAFAETALENVEIADSVNKIDTYAFYHCENLKNITIPDSVTEIGAAAFTSTALKEISIPSSVEKIRNHTFYHCENLECINIPENVKSIGIYAFEETALKNVDIPESVEEIGEGAFNSCKNLKSINVDSNNKNFCCENGALLNSEKTRLIQYSVCDERTEYQIPDSVNKIDKGAFNYCYYLKSINISSNNNYYCTEDGVLFNHNKTDLIQYPVGNDRTEYDIPNGVINIKSNSFSECKNITDLTIANSVECIESSAFAGCIKMGDITIPINVKKIGAYAFSGCWYWGEGTVTFKKTSDFEYDNTIFWNDFQVKLNIPIAAKNKYLNNDGTIIFQHVSNDKVLFDT